MPEIFFIGLLVFSLKGLENLQNWIFWKNLFFLKKCDFENFQALLEKKLKVLWKKFPGEEMLKIIQTIHFLYSELRKTTSIWIFWRKSKNQNFALLKKTIKYFSRTPVQALKKYFVFFKSKVEVVSFHQLFLPYKNIYNSLL